MSAIHIIKIGGKVIDDPALLDEFLTSFSALQGTKILVHGGGKSADKLLLKLGIQPKMINGRRITDSATIEVVAMTYSYLNKKIVAQLQSKKCNALGLSGADGNLIKATKREVNEIDFGFVGDIDVVNSKQLVKLLQSGVIPVFCALTYDNEGQLLNTNADTIASEIAISLSNLNIVNLIYFFDIVGVMDMEKGTLINEITPESFLKLKEDGILTGGILPKLENSFSAISNGVHEVIITHFNSVSNLGSLNFKGTRIHE